MTRCCQGLNVVLGISPEEKAEDQKFHFRLSLMSSVVGAIVGAIVGVALTKRSR